jgi:hypothetical protein
MALFGAPVAHEDHARRALLAALGIQQRLRDGGPGAGALGDVRVRIGVNTGTVVVGKIGDNLRMDYTAIGDTTNLAARLQGTAAPGSIRVSEATERVARPYFEFRGLGRQSLKGLAAPTPVYDLLGTRTGRADAAAPGTSGIGAPLVGRDRELAALAVAVEALGAGAVAGALVLRGEAGVGKSRLLAEARRRAAAAGVRWLEGRAVSFGRHLSYWPFIEIIKYCCGIGPGDGEAEAWHKSGPPRTSSASGRPRSRPTSPRSCHWSSAARPRSG